MGPKTEVLILKRFPDGKFYRTNEAMEFRMCVNGICDTTVAIEWHDSLCPCCRAEANLRKMAR